MAPHPAAAPERPEGGRPSAAQVFAALNEIRPANAILVEESPSNLSDLHTAWPVTEPWKRDKPAVLEIPISPHVPPVI